MAADGTMRGSAYVALWVRCGGAGVVEFRILGPLEVLDGATPVAVSGAKERALLADLLIHAGRVVAADRLIEDLWGERPPGNPANTLQGRVWALRRALGPVAARLTTRSPGYLLDVDPELVDAARFERLAADADRAAARDPARALGLLAEALGLWRGPALAEFADQPWAQAEAARLEELRLAAVELRAELRLAAGRHGELVGELEALVAAHPLRERPRGQLMLALYRSGRQADALGVYRETRALLDEELGVDPSPELQRLHQAILTQDPALEVEAPDRRRPPPHNLPERLTSFVGREVELREVGKLLQAHRLVTATGPGGAGKTSLAVELARKVAGGWPDGVWLVELAALRDPALVPGVVIATLGLGEEPGEPGHPPPAPAERLVEFARDKHLLLLLDSCEHLAAACAALAERLLRAAPGVKVLATSRELLGVAGEARWPVPPLAAPGPEETGGPPEALARFDAVRLFAERAALADPGFRLDAESGPAVAELCQRLDGMPLAIELAAARVRALPAGELLERLGDRFALLAGGGRTADPRQRTLRATVDWSHQLLGEADRRLFRRLAVFAGGFTVAAAEAVCGGDGLRSQDVLDGLLRLVDRSLVVAAGGRPARFRLLETLRAYGQERLAEAGEADAVTGRHTAWFLDLAERAARHRSSLRRLRLLDADYDNLRAALDRAVAHGDHQTALRLGGALGWYWFMFHHAEGRQRLADVLALADDQPPSPQLALALQAAAMVEALLTPTGAAVDTARRSLELFERFGDRQAAATSRLMLGLAEYQLGQAGAARLAEEAEAAFAEAGDPWGEAAAGLIQFVADADHLGPNRAETAGRRVLERFRALDDHWGIALTLFGLGEVGKARGDIAGAARRFEEALAAAREAGPTWIVGASLTYLASLAALQGDDDRATALYAEAVEFSRRTGLRRGLAFARNEMGNAARARGDLERARQLHQQALPVVREILGWSVPHTLGQLGCAEARLGDLDSAEAHLREAATLLLATPQPATAALILVGLALAALGHGRAEQATVLLGAAEATRERIGATPTGAERAEAELAFDAARSRLDADAIQAALTSGRGLATEQALQVALGPG
jgi:predicted ATPase/DNA-binding SARP family transcriptional activator